MDKELIAKILHILKDESDFDIRPNHTYSFIKIPTEHIQEIVDFIDYMEREIESE